MMILRIMYPGFQSPELASGQVSPPSLQPALQYLAGSLPVQQGMILPLLASHNTIRLSFDIEEGAHMTEYR